MIPAQQVCMIALSNPHMSNPVFNRLSTFIRDNYGIKLPLCKKPMLEGRLQKRLKALQMQSFHDYSEYIFSRQGQETEIVHMIDAVTTNKTDFFREAVHFDFLSKNVLSQYFNRNLPAKSFEVWSAGCSTGEEPYTLAMVLSEFAQKNPGFQFNILGTDISSRALDTAFLAVYPEEKIFPLPVELKKKYLLKNKDEQKRTIRIVPDLRAKVRFRRFNFLDGVVTFTGNFDVIFCRNVMIYFEKATQEKVISRLCTKLKQGGYLFLGHSESTSGMNLPLIQIQPTIYKKI